MRKFISGFTRRRSRKFTFYLVQSVKILKEVELMLECLSCFSYSCVFCDLSFAYRSSMKNHLIKIHNQADVSSLPLHQPINIAMRNDSDQDQLEGDQLQEIPVEEDELTSANNSWATNPTLFPTKPMLTRNKTCSLFLTKICWFLNFYYIEWRVEQWSDFHFLRNFFS